MTSKTKELTFEEILQKVESTIDKLQSGEMELDKSIDEFKEGMTLIKDAQKKLDSAKMKVQEVLKEGGEFSYKDIEG